MKGTNLNWNKYGMVVHRKHRHCTDPQTEVWLKAQRYWKMYIFHVMVCNKK